MSLDDFLNQRHVTYERLQHPPAFTASRIAVRDERMRIAEPTSRYSTGTYAISH